MKTKEQIFRIPIKYGELLNTMDDCECWKLIKALFIWKNDWLDWLTLTYFNIIMVDIYNIDKAVVNGWKWWRPKKDKPVVIKKDKPVVIENENQVKLSKVKLSKDNINIISNDITTEVEEFWNTEINNMQEFIKEKVESLWYIYKPWKQERNRIKNILTAKIINWLAEKYKMKIYNFVWNIILLSSKLDFRNWKITNAETFYKHYDKILNESVKIKQKQETEIVDYWLI